jgi:hypothetical protein
MEWYTLWSQNRCISDILSKKHERLFAVWCFTTDSGEKLQELAEWYVNYADRGYENELIITKFNRHSQNACLYLIHFHVIRRSPQVFQTFPTKGQITIESTAFWDIMPLTLYQLFAGTCFYPEDGGSRSLRNTGTYLLEYLVSHVRSS